MDRTIPQVGQLPVIETFALQPQRNTMIGVGALAQATIGQENASPAVALDGFVLSPTSPASLVVIVGPGSIYQTGVVDANAYGALPADNTDTITQQGISLSPTQLTLTPPSTVGFSVNYLIEVALSVQDNTPVVNPYYNASNPAANWEGPNNSGVSQNTNRQCLALIQAKAGVAATSGTQITPAADAGYFGVYSVTVANGATALNSGNWSTLATAPFIPAPLMAIPGAVQSGKWIYGADTGTANALNITLAPPPAALVTGLVAVVKKVASANTGASTLVVNGSGAIQIKTITGAALIGGEMPASSMLQFLYDGTNFQLQSAVSTAQVALMHFGTDSGTANAMTVTSVYPIVSTVTQGMHFTITKSANANTGALSATIMGTTAAVTWPDLTAFTGGEWAANADGLVVYDGNYRLLGPTTPFSFVIPGTPLPLFAPRSYYVNASTGSDANNGLTSGNPFLTIQKAITVTQSLNMNGYNVTINVANGTYAPITCGMLNGSGAVFLVGNPTTPSSCLIHATTGEAILVAANGYNFSGFAVQCDADGSAPHIGAGIRSTSGTASMQNMSFGACSTCHIKTDPNGVVVCHGVADGVPAAFINITGNALYHIESAGDVEVGATILNITGTLTFTNFWYASGGRIDSPYSAINFIGGATVTGSRYLIVNGQINTNGAGTSYLPGSTSGSASAPLYS